MPSRSHQYSTPSSKSAVSCLPVVNAPRGTIVIAVTAVEISTFQ